MRYANYHHNGREINTAGDNIQILAMDYIYSTMGIPQEDIVYIDTYDLSDYDGEYAVLPVYLPMFNHVENGIAGMFSSKIIPVFIGITWPLDALTNEEVNYLRRYEPIGCRDERTMMTMLRHGIQSYLNGCLTVAFPLSNVDRTKCEKIYVVDVPKKLMAYIPADYMKDAVIMSHNLSGNLEDAKRTASEIYQTYLKDARLVITSLLHCAIPCMAAGIPAVFAKNEFPYRAAWVEKLLPLYTEEEFHMIDWSPAQVHYEGHKNNFIELIKKRLYSAFDKHADVFSISYFYEQREKKPYTLEYTDRLQQFIAQKWGKNEAFNYSVWGLTHFAKYIHDYLSANYPNAVLSCVYDKYRKISLGGIDAVPPENIKHRKEEFVFVTSGGASLEAASFFRQINKPEESYFLLSYGNKK